MTRRFDVEAAERFGLGARLGHPPREDDLRSIAKPVRIWPVIREDGTLDLAQLVRPLSARKGWIWWVEGDPWALEPKATDLLVAVCASSGSTSGGRSLFLFETAQPERFLAWKHAIMREANDALVGYRSSKVFRRSSAARAALEPPMRDPDPPTPEVRRLYDGAIAYAELQPLVWPNRYLPECHWQEWPIQHVLIAGVGRGWDR